MQEKCKDCKKPVEFLRDGRCEDCCRKVYTMPEREILFRAWDISGERWLEFTLEDLAKAHNFNWANYRWWGQYTGLRDKKRTKEFPEGQRIFEGDTVISKGNCRMSGNPYEWQSRVEYLEGGFGLIHHGGNMEGCVQMFRVNDAQYEYNPGHTGTVEVIGSIHTNPDAQRDIDIEQAADSF